LDNKTENISAILFDIEKISNELKILIVKYNKFFNIAEIFSSENGGKTRLNRQLFNENHEDIQPSILGISLCLDESLTIVKEQLKEVLKLCGEAEKLEVANLIFDDENFIKMIELNLKNSVLSKELKSKYLKDINNILNLKNRLFNLKYYLDMFDTDTFDKYINKLGVEDLINSTIIFQIIDSYALQYEELKKFEKEIVNLNQKNEKITNLNNLNYILELHKRRTDNFIYADVRYKIFIDYDVETTLPKPIYLNKAYLENILSCFIEQSCLDLIKKELKKGKIQKQIEVNVLVTKTNIQLIVKNNGFEIKNIHSMFLSDVDNKTILEAKNLAYSLNGKLDIVTLENEGMQYSLTIKI
jgi:hypothetical protein